MLEQNPFFFFLFCLEYKKGMGEAKEPCVVCVFTTFNCFQVCNANEGSCVSCALIVFLQCF